MMRHPQYEWLPLEDDFTVTNDTRQSNRRFRLKSEVLLFAVVQTIGCGPGNELFDSCFQKRPRQQFMIGFSKDTRQGH